ncbi:hypothetical protein [Modestobacter sp. I12A-02662]|uniref:hypothetical protein n=1 Tax=Modestobacter sp. I12A-02662 TaxID=1730496 RepID=UPI0034DFD4F4
MPSLTAVVGAATLAFSVAQVAAPGLLIRPCGLEDTPDTRTVVRAFGVRDGLLGLGMVSAPAGRARRLATAARVVADWGDVAVFGTGLRGRRTRGPVAASAAAWGALALAAGVLDELHGG